MNVDRQLAQRIVEGAIFASPAPLSLDELQAVFPDGEKPTRSELQRLVRELQEVYAQRAIELVEVASGYRFQVRAQYSSWIGRLWQEKPARLSRASLETLAIIAYRQPVTRAEIEAIRGVVVSSQIIRHLLDLEWVTVVGHREVPGRPELLATTRQFLDAFNLHSLADLPPLAAVRDLDSITRDLERQNADKKQQQLRPEETVGQ